VGKCSRVRHPLARGAAAGAGVELCCAAGPVAWEKEKGGKKKQQTKQREKGTQEGGSGPRAAGVSKATARQWLQWSRAGVEFVEGPRVRVGGDVPGSVGWALPEE